MASAGDRKNMGTLLRARPEISPGGSVLIPVSQMRPLGPGDWFRIKPKSGNQPLSLSVCCPHPGTQEAHWLSEQDTQGPPCARVWTHKGRDSREW